MVLLIHALEVSPMMPTALAAHKQSVGSRYYSFFQMFNNPWMTPFIPYLYWFAPQPQSLGVWPLNSPQLPVDLPINFVQEPPTTGTLIN